MFENVGLLPDVALYRLDFVIMVVISFFKYFVVSKRRAVADPEFERRDLRIFISHTIRVVLQHAFLESFEI